LSPPKIAILLIKNLALLLFEKGDRAGAQEFLAFHGNLYNIEVCSAFYSPSSSLPFKWWGGGGAINPLKWQSPAPNQ